MTTLKNDLIALGEFILIIVLSYCICHILLGTLTIVTTVYGSQVGHLSQTLSNIVLLITLFSAVIAALLLLVFIHKKYVVPFF